MQKPSESVTTDSIHSYSTAGLRRPGARASGFTLVEMALALVIIALLIGGMLKGWQMVQSARVRTTALTITSIQSAYFAFFDRFGHVAGDWNAASAGLAIGRPVTGGGNDSGRLDTTPGNPWTESNAFWEQLAKAGFINGDFPGIAAEPTVDNGLAPLNVFNRPMLIGRTPDFEGAAGGRRHILVGRGAPAGALRALDVKLDDGKPGAGTIRATVDDASVSVFGGAHLWGGRASACVTAGAEWNADDAPDDCNALLLF